VVDGEIYCADRELLDVPEAVAARGIVTVNVAACFGLEAAPADPELPPTGATTGDKTVVAGVVPPPPHAASPAKTKAAATRRSAVISQDATSASDPAVESKGNACGNERR
jgi:hypothetical protein